MKKNIFIVGARGYKFNYGGWETFVTNLILNNKNEDFEFYIPHLTFIKDEDKKINRVDGVICPLIYTPQRGFATMFNFTIKAMNYVTKFIQENHLKNTVILLLGCKVGPLIPIWKNKLKDTKFIINPDGLEWKRDKWSWWIKECFKISERMCVKYCDCCVCDSKAIQNYIDEKYENYQTPSSFIAYGAYENQKAYKNSIVRELWKKYDIKDKNYYLIVGRFVPENNYEIMIREFMSSNTKKDFAIITNVNDKFLNQLEERLHFKKDSRIKFVGTVYDQELLMKIRENAYGYFHGHEVGGTNPSLLEALGSTDLNLLLNVGFNREVAQDGALYWDKKTGDLSKLIEKADIMSAEQVKNLAEKAKLRIREAYSWEYICKKYENVFLK